MIAISSNKVVLPDTVGNFIIIEDKGKIVDILPKGSTVSRNIEHREFGDLVIMAGIIDPHVHINEPGRTEWEGFETGTTAAVAGGVTTLVDMPLNSSPVTITVKDFEDKLAAAQGKMHMNCGFWGGLVPNNTEHIKGLAERGVLGFKAFLTHSGIDEFPNVTESDLRKAYEELGKKKIPILAHCELVSGDYGQELAANPTNYLAYLSSRPRKWENDAVRLMLKLAEEYNHPTHIVHLSSTDCLDEIRAAKKRGVPVTVETCPHYLYFNAETIPNANTRYKCAPPIREKANNALLWEALLDGTLDFIGSDHSPAPPAIKELDSGNFQKAWGGISGIQFTLPAIWTLGKNNGLSLSRLAQVLCEVPAQFIGLGKQKGKIAVGYDADFVIWDKEEAYEVKNSDIQARHKVSPYKGELMYGTVKNTVIGGYVTWDNSRSLHTQKGKILLSKVKFKK